MLDKSIRRNNMYLYCDIMIWIAAFGFSELLLEVLHIKSRVQRLIYYLTCLLSAIVVMCYLDWYAPTRSRVDSANLNIESLYL